MPTYPLPLHADGRKANISDGFHTIEDKAAGRAKRSHNGADVMYWIPRLSKARGKVDHPYSTGAYEIPRPASLGGYDVPALATETGVVLEAGKLTTGWWVKLNIGNGRHVAYNHLASVLVSKGAVVGEGTALGFVGGSPVGYGLWHLHFAMRVGGHYVDPAPYLAKCRHVSLADVWGDVGRVA